MTNETTFFGTLAGKRGFIDGRTFQTKLFHQNSETTTNTWAAESIGKVLHRRANVSRTIGLRAWKVSSSRTRGVSEQMDYELQPREFTTLKKGGRGSAFQVEGIVFRSGRRFANGRSWLKTAFSQGF